MPQSPLSCRSFSAATFNSLHRPPDRVRIDLKKTDCRAEGVAVMFQTN